MKLIRENTGISVSLVIMLIGGVVWLSSLYSLAGFTADRVTKVEVNQDVYMKDVHEIKERVIVIEQILRERRDE